MHFDNETPRVFRMVTGPVLVVEEWVNQHWIDYIVVNWAWSVIDGKQHVTAQAVLRTEAERAMRMAQLAAHLECPAAAACRAKIGVSKVKATTHLNKKVYSPESTRAYVRFIMLLLSIA